MENVHDIYWVLNYVLLAKFGLAVLLGAVLGVERDIHGRAAGVRTHMLISAGAVLFTLASIAPFEGGDPRRIAASIVSGVGFLGAGAILKSGLSVRGLTTAAGMWLSASIGVLCGIGNFTLAIIVTVVVLLAHLVGKWVEGCLNRLTCFQLIVDTPDPSFREQVLKTIGRECKSFTLSLMNVTYKDGTYHYELEFDADASHNQSAMAEFIVRRLKEISPELSNIAIKCLS